VSFRSRNRYYYSDAGLDVEFLAGKGGVDAGRQVGTGKADFAEVFGDTTIILRSEGVPIRMVALMGGRGPMVLATQAGSGVKNLKDLKGKSISILGYQDSTYYVLLAALASVNLSKEDVSIQALGPSGVIQEFIKGNVQVCACIPDWIVTAEDASVEMDP
jgi:NitT/TauT family transport system substrate-binding protein